MAKVITITSGIFQAERTPNSEVFHVYVNSATGHWLLIGEIFRKTNRFYMNGMNDISLSGQEICELGIFITSLNGK